jgi:hypothetical protein
MKITVEGTEKEIAAFVVEIQKQQKNKIEASTQTKKISPEELQMLCQVFGRQTAKHMAE